MLFDGIKLVEGSEFQNLVVDTGSTFPASPAEGEMFYRNDGANEGLYLFNGSDWIRQIGDGDSFDTLLPDVGTPGTYRSVTVNDKGLVTAGTNPTTLSGYGITDAQPLDGDLTAIAAISATSGLLHKTAANTWSLDTNTYLTGNQTITVSGDVSGSGTTAITLSLATTGVAAGSYGTSSALPTISIDSKGRISSASNTPIAIDASAVTSGSFASTRISQASVTQHEAALTISENQITDGALLARIAGNETISGSWTFNNAVVGQTPTIGSHLTTKDYVDNVAAGVNPLASVRAATTANITLSGEQTVDGVSVVAGDRVLVKNQSTPVNNGIYLVSASSWTRTSDFDGSPTNEVSTGDLVFVEEGTSNANSSWILVTAGSISIGTTPLTFSVFSRAGDFEAGSGLTKSGNTFNVGTASSSRIVVNVDDIDLATTGVTPDTYAAVTVDAYGRVTAGSTTQDWATVSGAPTTLAGYGITDAQALDSDLTAIAGLSSTGIIVRTGTGTASTRSISIGGTGLGLTITNGDGVSGGISINSTAAATNDPSSLVYRDASGNFAAGTITASLTGNASTATALATGRTISVSGDVTGTSASFDGTANATISTTLANSGVTANTYGSSTLIPVITVDAKGRITSATTSAVSAGATVAGANTQVQYNNSGALGASANFTWDNSNNRLNLNGAVGLTTAGGIVEAAAAGTGLYLGYLSSTISSTAGTYVAVGGASATAAISPGQQLGTLILAARNTTNAGVSIATSNTSRLFIHSNGAWGLGGANYGTAGQVLASNGSSSPPTWQTVSTATTATNIAGGSAGQILYQSGTSTTTSSSTFTYNGAGGLVIGSSYASINGGTFSLNVVGGSASATAGSTALTLESTALSSGNATHVLVKAGTTGSGQGGNVSLTASNGTGTNTDGGAIYLTSGNSVGTGTGGQITLSTGTPGASGTGGPINLTTGGGGTNGGNITFTPGSGTTKNGMIVMNGAYQESRSAVTSTATTTLNCSLTNNFVITMTTNISTLAFSNVPVSGNVYNLTMFITQDGSGNKTLAWPASVKWAGGTAPTITAAANKTDIITLVTHNGGTTWYGFIAGQNF